MRLLLFYLNKKIQDYFLAKKNKNFIKYQISKLKIFKSCLNNIKNKIIPLFLQIY